MNQAYVSNRRYAAALLCGVAGLISTLLGAWSGCAAEFLWNPARTNGASDGSGTWDLSTQNWWNGSTVTSWINGSSATFGNSGAAGTVSLGAAITVSNITFNAATNDNSLTAQYGKKPIVGYLDYWDPNYLYNPSAADCIFSNLTHLVYIGPLNVKTNAELVVSDLNGGLSNVVAITHAHGRKISITLGDTDGVTANSTLAVICPSTALRATLITRVLQFCKANNLDGLDIDWEFPTASQEASFVTFLQQLRAAAPPGFLISVAVMTGDSQMAQAPVDWFYVMGYTFTLNQLISIELNSWVSSGAPLSKVVVGMGCFGANSSGGALGYSTLIGTNNIDPSLNYYNGYTFTGINTVRQITQYVYNNSFGGIGWFLVKDDTCDSRSLLLAGANQARASAAALGLGDGYLIQNGTLTLSSGTTFTANSNATINSVLAGNDGWTKMGPGTLVLGGNNSFSGGKYINAGTVRIANGKAFGNDGYGVYVAPGATLELAGATTYDFNLSGGLAGTLRSTISGATLQAANYKNQGLSDGGTIDVPAGATLLVWDPVWGGGGFIKSGAGILYLLSNASTITGNITIQGGVLQIGGATPSNINGTKYNGSIVNNGLLDMETTTSQTLGGVISGTGSLRKGQNITLTISGTNTYTGGTTVDAGTLLVSGSLDAGSTVTVASGAVLGGTGTVNGAVTLNGAIAPRNGVGVSTLATGAQTWNGAGRYVCELNGTNAAGSDRLNITGALNVQASPGSPFTIKLVSLTSSNTPGPLAGFNPFACYTWTIASASSVQNFATNKFLLDTSAFSNDWSRGGFTVALAVSNLVLNYLAAPSLTPRFIGSPALSLSGVQLGGTGLPCQAYVLQGATNLTPTIVWTPLATNRADTNGLLQFTDPQGTNYPQRFYRIITP